MDLLTRLAREQQRAVVLVTHDDRTLGYADRIVHIEDGTLREGNAPALDRPEPRTWGLAPRRTALAFE
jgi:putative ABC transport system ATP-binding protein